MMNEPFGFSHHDPHPAAHGVLPPPVCHHATLGNCVILGRGAKTAWVRDAIGQFPKVFGVGELVRACSGVSRPMIRVVLEALRKEGKLEVLGTGRGAKWRKRDNIQ